LRLKRTAARRIAPPSGVIVDHSPILDYASPASRARLRLPARSIITTEHDAGRFIVREKLAGEGEAIMALLFAAFTLVVMAGLQWQMSAKWHRNAGAIGMLALLQAAELAVGAPVVNSTWRRTTLIITADDVTLAFTAPFSSGRRYHWPAEQLAAVEVIDSEPLANGTVVPEIELRMWTGAPVRLFAGHGHAELVALAADIRAVQPPLPSAQSAGPRDLQQYRHRLGEW
jgi:hypothetical protein